MNVRIRIFSSAPSELNASTSKGTIPVNAYQDMNQLLKVSAKQRTSNAKVSLSINLWVLQMQRDALSKWSEMIMTMIAIQVYGLDSDVERENQSQLQQYILYKNNNNNNKKKKKKKKKKKN